MAATRPATELLVRLRGELAHRVFEQPRLPGNLLLALVDEVLAHRAREDELAQEAAEISDEDLPPERRPTPARPARRRTSGPWARGAELRPADSDVEELDLTVPDVD